MNKAILVLLQILLYLSREKHNIAGNLLLYKVTNLHKFKLGSRMFKLPASIVECKGLYLNLIHKNSTWNQYNIELLEIQIIFHQLWFLRCFSGEGSS